MSEGWDETYRDVGIDCDKALVVRAEELWLCGPRISPGMQIELETFLEGEEFQPSKTAPFEAKMLQNGKIVYNWTGAGRHLPRPVEGMLVHIRDTIVRDPDDLFYKSTAILPT